MGLTIYDGGKKEIGEWHHDKLHGVGKKEWTNRDRYWGQLKND